MSRAALSRVRSIALGICMVVAAFAVVQAPPVAPARAVWVFVDRAVLTTEQLDRAIARTGGRVRYHSVWLSATSADLSPASIRRLRRTPGVLRLQPVGRVYASANDDAM